MTIKRALLLFNPEATSVSPRVRDVIAHALASEVELEVVGTKRRHHATHLAGGAAHEGFDAVVSLGGDGTLNEVINGLAGTDVPVVPLPGGGTNVFARTMGLPRDPIEATSIVLERIAAGAQPRPVPLGKVNDRYFAFHAGLGFDAAVVRAVERSPAMKRRLGEPFFILQAVRTFYAGYPRARSPMTLQTDEVTIGSLKQIVVCNTDPYTFLGNKPFRVCPRAGITTRLDATMLTTLRTVRMLRTVFGAFAGGRHLRRRWVKDVHDVPSIVVTCDEPVPYQVDGDYAGEQTSFRFQSVPDALTVLA